jgi:hypothetical protein
LAGSPYYHDEAIYPISWKPAKRFHVARSSYAVFPLPGDPAEDPMVNEPELRDDVERNHVARRRARRPSWGR